ncbi:MAG: NAD(P)H-dependent oxidoreductase subunit E [Ectothiorhodospiraceae bacterium]|nr:NAD(P)H-dependent oxidoreductase subunit E [Ectothiorhodospiraceae bacterium]
MASPSTHLEFDAERVREIARRWSDRDGGLLPALLEINDRFGHVDARAVPILAEALNRSRAEVHGVLSFYHDLRTEPPARHTVALCQGEACQAVGATRLLAEIRQAGLDDHDVQVAPVYCLGNCALGPCALVDGELVARLDRTQLIGCLS